jgi:NitT/TauT family transport system ATP-binding protein
MKTMNHITPASRGGGSISISKLTMVYASKTGAVQALKDIDLHVEPGEFICVVGPSGCGKSTLMMLVAGLRSATSGTVHVGDELVTSPRHEVGIVFQRDVLLDWRTSLDNVLFQVEMRKLKKSKYVGRALELLHSIGLDGFVDKRPGELSGGMRQRVAICRALIHDPAVLLMDEPFGALDALTREQLMVELQRIYLEQRKTVLFITHSIPEAVYLADRVVVMGSRPGVIKEILSIDLSRPRSFDDQAVEMTAYSNHIRHLLGV